MRRAAIIMKAELVRDETVAAFKEYREKHRNEVDDSYLYEEDLDNFKISGDYPSYILKGRNGKVVAAASLIMDEYHRSGGNGRFRIFHSEIENIDCYKTLLDAILEHTDGLERIFIFIPAENEKTRKFFEGLGFCADRYAYMLLRDDTAVPDIPLPDDYALKPFIPGQDEGVWCAVRNAGFAKLKGSQMPITPQMIVQMTQENDYLEGGMMILTHKNKPVGIVRGASDEYEGEKVMCIGPLAVVPEYQGKGLGRILLKASLRFACERGFKSTVLSVNADNERALALYLDEGYKVKHSVVCYQYLLTRRQSSPQF